ncbi:class I SAM-dependent methyltransferase [Streptomyces sp. NPDC001177]
MGNEARIAAREQWSANPAGTHHAAAPEGTPEFYEQMTRSRYELQPWLPRLLRAWVPSGRVLEVGCGAGTDHAMIAAIARETAAVDLSERCVRLTQTRLDLEDRPGIAQVADAENLPYPDATFDGAYSFGVLHHTDHPEKAVEEIRRVLRPGGTFMVGLYHRDSLFAAEKVAKYVATMSWRRQSWRDFLPEIEFGAVEREQRPLVRLYSRKSARELFGRFHEVRTRVEHPAFRGVLLPEWLRPLGFFVMVTGRR